MTPDELTRLRELHEQASPAPWEIEPYIEGQEPSNPVIDSIASLEGPIISQLGCGCCDVGLESNRLANFELTIEARNALPGLLDHIDRLTRRVEIYEARLGRVARNHPEAYEQALAGDTQ